MCDKPSRGLRCLLQLESPHTREAVAENRKGGEWPGGLGEGQRDGGLAGMAGDSTRTLDFRRGAVAALEGKAQSCMALGTETLV